MALDDAQTENEMKRFVACQNMRARGAERSIKNVMNHKNGFFMSK
jgi:hypothetical protein